MNIEASSLKYQAIRLGQPYVYNREDESQLNFNFQDEESQFEIPENIEHIKTFDLDYVVNYEIKTNSGDLKVLVEKNPIIIVYKPIIEEDGEIIQENIKQLNERISKAVAYLYNSQFIIRQRNIAPLPGKYAIKHLITKTQSLAIARITYFNPQQEEFYVQHTKLLENISTLYYYVEEAIDKQNQGTVNNALFLIQQPIVGMHNNFSAACWLHCFNSNDPKHKFVFINLSDEESVENLQFWSEVSGFDQKAFLYFSLLNLRDESSEKKFSSLQNEIFSNRISLIPYKNQDNKLTMWILSILMNDFFYRQIESFHPDNIALNIKISDLQKYEPEALLMLIQTLSKLCFNKLLIYFQFDKDVPYDEQQIQYQLIVNAINICYYAFQIKKIKVKEDLSEIQNIKFYFQLRRMAELYKKLMPSIQTQMLLGRCQILKTQIKKVLEQLRKNSESVEQFKQQLEELVLEEDSLNISYLFSLIFYKSGSRVIIISAQLEDQDIMDAHTGCFIFYSDNYILLSQLNNESRNFLYIFDTRIALASKDIFQSHKFQKIPLPESKPDGSILYYLKQRLYLIYGKRQNKFCDTIYYLDIAEIKSNSWKLLERQQNQYKKEQIALPNKQQNKEFVQQQFSAKIKEEREGPTICCYSCDSNEISILLFGGINARYFFLQFSQPQIMNAIEQIDITQKEFQSFVYDKDLIYKRESLRPSWFQTVLESDIAIKDARYFICLPKIVDKMGKYDIPMNFERFREANILKQSKCETLWQKGQIIYCDSEYFPIERIQNNNSQNVELLHQNEISIIWKIIFTQACKKQEFIKLKSKYTYQQITSPEFDKILKENNNKYLNSDFFQCERNTWMEQTAIVQKEGENYYLNPQYTNRIASEDQISVLAIENYFKYNIAKNEIFVKQNTYELIPSIKINTDSIEESLNISDNQNQQRSTK